MVPFVALHHFQLFDVYMGPVTGPPGSKNTSHKSFIRMTQLSCKHCESLRKVPQKFTFVTQNFCFWTIPKGLLVYGVGEVIADHSTKQYMLPGGRAGGGSLFVYQITFLRIISDTLVTGLGEVPPLLTDSVERFLTPFLRFGSKFNSTTSRPASSVHFAHIKESTFVP